MLPPASLPRGYDARVPARIPSGNTGGSNPRNAPDEGTAAAIDIFPRNFADASGTHQNCRSPDIEMLWTA
jgi:hypothetical protein